MNATFFNQQIKRIVKIRADIYRQPVAYSRTYELTMEALRAALGTENDFFTTADNHKVAASFMEWMNKATGATIKALMAKFDKATAGMMDSDKREWLRKEVA
jgi:hypothetical protein